MPRHIKSTHEPPDRPPDLFALMPLCGVDDFDGALGAVYRCPFCGGRPKTAQPMPEARRGIETLRVYLDTHSEVVFRCHNCGLAAAAPELVGKRSGLPWSQIAERLRHHRVFGDDDDAPEHWVRRAEEWDRFAGMFEKAKAWFRRLARAGRIGEASFAEVGIGAAFLLERALPGVKLVSRWGRRTLFTAELRRSILGLPNHVLIRHRKRGHAVAVFEFGPREPLYLTMPEWVLYRDWADELTVFTDLGLGGELMEHLASHPSGVAPPAAWIADCNGPVADEVPCRTVRYMPTGRESPELGLAFVQPGVRAMVRDEDAVDSVADFIIERTRNSDPIAYLHTVLQKPWVTAAAARLLTEAVAARLGGQATALIARSGASDRVLPYTIRGTTYLCRNGVYAKRRGKGDWQPCANFSLRVEESGLEEDREVAHEILLQMDGRSAGFTALDHELHDGPALLKLAAATAIGEGFPDVPRVLEPGDIGRLPSIVMATQLKPALRTLIPPALGFDRGRFHGHNFTATGRGVAFGASCGTARCRRASSMLPEDPWEPPDDHLACRANELATWLGSLEPAERRMASAMVHAGLAWLHRGGRGLPSYLLLPSAAHLDLLGALTGVIPIDVGHGPGEHTGVPCLMRSSYWRPDQFERRGRVVAAIEERTRKVDPQIPLVVHRWARPSAPSPPAGILSLLTHSALVAPDPRSASGRLISLVECPELRGRLRPCLEMGAGYLADTGRYLDVFLEAAGTLPDIEGYLIRKRGKTLLEREVVKRLNEDLAFGFRGTRLIDELRARFPLAQPGRYGRAQVPIFRLPEDALTTG